MTIGGLSRVLGVTREVPKNRILYFESQDSNFNILGPIKYDQNLNIKYWSDFQMNLTCFKIQEGGGRGEELTFLENCTHGSKTTSFQHFGYPTIQFKFQQFFTQVFFNWLWQSFQDLKKNLKCLSKNESCSHTFGNTIFDILDPKICGKFFQVLPKWLGHFVFVLLATSCSNYNHCSRFDI